MLVQNIKHPKSQFRAVSTEAAPRVHQKMLSIHCRLARVSVGRSECSESVARAAGESSDRWQSTGGRDTSCGTLCDRDTLQCRRAQTVGRDRALGPLGNKVEKEGYERNKVVLNRVQK